jgi:hypothetical protein
MVKGLCVISDSFHVIDKIILPPTEQFLIDIGFLEAFGNSQKSNGN